MLDENKYILGLKEWLGEEEAELYMFGDPDVERDKNGMLNVKIWNLDDNKIS